MVGMNKPVYTQLTESSNALLGILLAELLMRGLTIRLYVEKNGFQKRQPLPKNLSDLWDYLDETLWVYSCPTVRDNAILMTRDGEVFSAHDVIFPQRLIVSHNEQEIEVTIEPKMVRHNEEEIEVTTKPEVPLSTTVPPTRYASNFEVKMIKALLQNSIENAPFQLVNGGHPSLTGDMDLVVAYEQPECLDEKVAQHDEALKLLSLQASITKNIQNLTKIINKTNEKVQFELHQNNLELLSQILLNSVEKIKNPKLYKDVATLDNMPKYDFLNESLPAIKAVEKYVEKLTAFLILFNRKN
jgi:hypothetical protein